ncbi:hypothetical protein MUN78_15340 [Leucobacter allii]|uniref:Uncharacterized protein n=1 Tax=Leucobacter allii TaxID=2932247 RepID=A0ABY4FL81_9MICO|nr:hypothetical protein [Leucobacter allii]UOQ57016.1 hypothetical protein MUN78_15340 [Leucobacter allii]
MTDPSPEESFVPTPFLVRGDPVTAVPPDTDAPEGAPSRGLLWGVDLADCATRRAARDRWHRSVHGLKRELDRLPGIRRLCVACRRPTRFPQSMLVQVPSDAASRIHTDLERDRARYLQVLVLDITDCAAPVTLQRRLEEALGSRSGAWTDVTLAWRDIEGCGFTEAWAGDAL